MALYSSLFSPPNLVSNHTVKSFATPSNFSLQILKTIHLQQQQPIFKLTPSPIVSTPRGRHYRKPPFAVAEETAVTSPPPLDPKSEAARKLYVGNIPRNVNNAELARIFEEHGAVEKAEVVLFPC